MTIKPLSELYRAYIDCLNRQDWNDLGRYVADAVEHNHHRLGLSGYREMLQESFRDIPDLRFDIERLVCDTPHVAARLAFDCTPTGEFLGLKVGGRRVSFTENVFYAYRDEKIASVLSVIDKAAIESQIAR